MSADQKPFFVVGSARCGGTLLYGLLCSSVYANPVLAETHFFSEVTGQYIRNCSREAIEKDHFFINADERRQFYSRQIQSFTNHLFQRYKPAKLLVLKSITLGEYLFELHKLIPEAGFIILIRDPRDIASSMIRVGERQITQGLRPQYSRSMPDLGSRIMSSYRSLLDPEFKSVLAPACHVLRYEDLVTNVSGEIQRLSDWVGIDLDIDPKKPWSRTDRDFDKIKSAGSPYASEHWGEAVTSGTIGSYRSILTDIEVEQLTQYCAPLMQRYDYTPHSV